jgi:hypothetical protein
MYSLRSPRSRLSQGAARGSLRTRGAPDAYQMRTAALSYRLTHWCRLLFLLIASVLPSRKPRVIDADSPSRSGCNPGRPRLCGF